MDLGSLWKVPHWLRITSAVVGLLILIAVIMWPLLGTLAFVNSHPI